MQTTIKKLEGMGYTKNFVVRKGLLWSGDQSYRPGQVKIDKTMRIENDSDPNNQSIVYGLTCQGGERGLIVNGFGLNSDPVKDDFIMRAANQ